MIEFNGWITIEIYADRQEHYTTLEAAISELNSFLLQFRMFNQSFEIKNFNGINYLIIVGNHNHDTGYSDDILRLLEKIAKITPGSYGLIYIRWPEDEILCNQFKVYKLAKGVITIEDDSLLSPCNSVIEN